MELRPLYNYIVPAELSLDEKKAIKAEFLERYPNDGDVVWTTHGNGFNYVTFQRYLKDNRRVYLLINYHAHLRDIERPALIAA